jgi:heat shock protein HtpX
VRQQPIAALSARKAPTPPGIDAGMGRAMVADREYRHVPRLLSGRRWPLTERSRPCRPKAFTKNGHLSRILRTMTNDPPPTARRRLRQPRHPLLEATLLLGGMALLLGVSGWIVGGGAGALVTLFAGAISFLLAGSISPQLLLRIYRARPLSPAEVPALAADLAELCRRAGIANIPTLCRVSSPFPIAFTVGSREEATITLSNALLRLMNERELVGIVAHEVSHIRRGDLSIMRLANAISHVIRTVSQFGIVMVIANLWLHLLSLPNVPWLHVAVLLVAPIVANLMQLALSRTRELEADLDAVELTADPVALASALDKLDRAEARIWRWLFPRGTLLSVPTWLRTHPLTRDRIRRLLEAESG